MVAESEPILIAGAGLTTGEAARRLGISPEAVRKRVKRETLRGVKVGSRWQIAAEGPFERVAVGYSRENRDLATELASVLYDEVVYLRRQLEEANRERSELRQLAGQAQALAAHVLTSQAQGWQSPALAAPAPVTLEREPAASTAAPAKQEDRLAALLQRRSVAAARPEPVQPQAAAPGRADPLLEAMRRRAQNGAQPAAAPPTAPTTAQDDAAASQDARLAALDRAIARYTATGWRVATKLDVRAELTRPGSTERLYLEAAASGEVSEQRF